MINIIHKAKLCIEYARNCETIDILFAQTLDHFTSILLYRTNKNDKSHQQNIHIFCPILTQVLTRDGF